MRVEHMDYAVVPDLHGRYELLEVTASIYPRLMLLGDMVDGGNTRKTLELVSQLPDDTIVLAGNHEYVLDAALHETNDEARDIWTEVWLRPYHKDVLRSYGLPNTPSVETADMLAETMPKAHRRVLRDMAMYCIGPSFFAVHAGITDLPLSTQMRLLDVLDDDRKHGNFNGEIPLQLVGKEKTSGDRVLDPDTIDGRAVSMAVLDEAQIEVMINGHWHRNRTQQAVKAGGRVIHLAQNPYYDELPVLELWSGQIKTVTRPHVTSMPSTYEVDAQTPGALTA